MFKLDLKKAKPRDQIANIHWIIEKAREFQKNIYFCACMCCQRRSEGSNKPCEHQDPETPQRLRQNCVWVSPAEVRVSSGLLRGQGLWAQ